MLKKSLVRCSLLSLLLLGTVAASAHATFIPPIPNVLYTCFYYNYSGPASPQGWLVFGLTGTNTTYIYGTETFQTPDGSDNRKVVFAKPVDNGYYTTWEFTEPLDGVQCKNTQVSNGGRSISFQSCTDGETRYCQH